MSRQRAHRTPQGTVIVPGGDYNYQHEYKFIEGRLYHRYVQPDDTPHTDESGQWEYVSEQQIVQRYRLYIPELNQLLAENGYTQDAIEAIAEAERQARPKRGRPRRR
jgi:hypothetical protein